MNEPKTIADAKRLTLKKIEECMKRPIRERGEFWYMARWPEYYDGAMQHCAFCIIINKLCDRCVARTCCHYFIYEMRWEKRKFRKLYRMVKEIEV